MANRQVRLDPDVADLVESVMEPGESWSKATNTVLREVLTAPTDGPAATAPPGRAAAVARAARGNPTRPGSRAPRRGLGRRGGTAGRCPHPVTRLIGDRCGVCGDQV